MTQSPGRLDVAGFTPGAFAGGSFEVDQLVVRSFHSSPEPGNGQEAPTQPTQTLIGRARMKEGQLVALGSTVRPAEALIFHLRPFASGEALAQHWEAHWAHGQPTEDLAEPFASDQQLLAYLIRVHEGFAQRPPTVELWFTEPDPESDQYRSEGDEGEPWYLSCQVPEGVFEAIREDVLVGRCDRLQLVADLEPSLVDDPWNRGWKLAVLRGKYGMGSCRGWVRSLFWDSVPAGRDAAAARVHDTKHVAALEHQLGALARTTRWGVIALFALVAFFIVRALAF